MESRRKTVGALTNIAVLERELGAVEYRLHRIGEGDACEEGEPDSLRQRRADLLQALDAQNKGSASHRDAPRTVGPKVLTRRPVTREK